MLEIVGKYVQMITYQSYNFSVIGFLTLPTAYVTGNPVECVLHPSLWNDSGVWDAVGVGQLPVGNPIGNDNDDDAEFVEENIGYPVSSVSDTFLMS